MQSVTVVIGSGMIGQAIARRVSADRLIVLADLHAKNAKQAAETLADAGFVTRHETVDVADRQSVEALAALTSELGRVERVVHAAGVSPSQAPIETILKVDLYGTALVLELFGDIIAPGGSGVVISSQSSHRLPALSAEDDGALATTPAEELLALPLLAGGRVRDTLHAYQLSKRANSLRVAAEAVRWGERGARINALSPGIVITPLAREELEGTRGAGYRRMLDLSPAGRAGTPDEIGALAAHIMGESGAFITGSDILIDGGVTASFKYGPLQPADDAG